MNLIDKKVSIQKSIIMLAKNGIQVDEEEALVILDFLYLMAKNQKKFTVNQNPKGKSNFEKMS